MIHHTAVIGASPEHRDWDEHRDGIKPVVPPSTRVSRMVTVDAGMERATVVGERCFLLAKSHIGHDAVLGDDCEIATGAVIGGHAELGDKVRIGLNATVLPFKKIGEGARIGAGAVVTRDVPAGEIWVGVPARPIDRDAWAGALPPHMRS